MKRGGSAVFGSVVWWCVREARICGVGRSQATPVCGKQGLTGTTIHRQLFCNQHLRTPLRSAANTGLIIPLESALTKNAPATPLESALPKNRGAGVSLSTADPTNDFYPEEHRDGGSLRVAQPFLAVLLQPISGHKPRPCALPLSRSALLSLTGIL